LVFRKKQTKFSLVGSFLGVLWIWIGAVYHLCFFSAINKPAFVFGLLFILQGILFLINTFSKSAIQFQAERTVQSSIGVFFVLFGIVIYPLIGYLVENSLSHIISLGLPCPSTIATFGFLMLAIRKVPKYLLIIPILWSVIGLSAAINFGVIQDYMLIVSALIAVFFLFKKK
ncbi:MAG TPA: DUF6064 family protein, partial [Prolixibacteraceae bacterium]|nr:DUF6064 family protein [Prolixibacteraceae bacterium]